MALHHRVIAASTSGQSHLIVAAILLSFVVWTTLQGTLHVYLNALGIGAPPAPGVAGGGIGGGVGSAIGGAIGGGFGLPIPSIPGAPSVFTPGINPAAPPIGQGN